MMDSLEPDRKQDFSSNHKVNPAMIHVNPGSKTQNRRACNRCHQAKLKCVVEDGQLQPQKCRRCKRTNAECIFSPASRTRATRRRSKAQPQPPTTTSSPSSSSSPSADTASPIDYHLNGWSDVLDMNLDSDLNGCLDASLQATFDLELNPTLGLDSGISSAPYAPFEYGTLNQSQSQSCDHSNVISHSHSPHDLPMGDLSPCSLIVDASSTYVPTLTRPSAPLHTGYDNVSPTARLQTGPVQACTWKGVGNQNGIFGGPTMLPSPEGEVNDGEDEDDEEDEQFTSMTYWAERVTMMNVEFTRHLQTIPQLHLTPENAHNETECEIPTGLSTPSKTHNSDRTFHLSESFIDLLSAMCSKLPPLQQDPTAKKHNLSAFLCLDEASHLVIFSTYLRLLEVHEAIFRYLLICLVHKREDTPAGAGSCFYLPKLTIGSFSLAQTSETRPLLFVNLMESLLARARNLMHRIASGRVGSGQTRKGSTCGSTQKDHPGSLPPIIEPDLAMQAMRARETAILNLVERIKAALARIGAS